MDHNSYVQAVIYAVLVSMNSPQVNIFFIPEGRPFPIFFGLAFSASMTKAPLFYKISSYVTQSFSFWIARTTKQNKVRFDLSSSGFSTSGAESRQVALRVCIHVLSNKDVWWYRVRKSRPEAYGPQRHASAAPIWKSTCFPGSLHISSGFCKVAKYSPLEVAFHMWPVEYSRPHVILTCLLSFHQIAKPRLSNLLSMAIDTSDAKTFYNPFGRKLENLSILDSAPV